jgi:hypothetical protein
MPYIQKDSPLKQLQKKETQQELDDRFKKFIIQNEGAHAFTDDGRFGWPTKYDNIKNTTFNAKWRDKITKDALHTRKMKNQMDSLGRQQRKEAERNNPKIN